MNILNINNLPEDFKKVDDDNINFGQYSGTAWVRLNIFNSSNQNDWLLKLVNPMLDEVTLYREIAPDSFDISTNKDYLPLSSRSVLSSFAI